MDHLVGRVALRRHPTARASCGEALQAHRRYHLCAGSSWPFVLTPAAGSGTAAGAAARVDDKGVESPGPNGAQGVLCLPELTAQFLRRPAQRRLGLSLPAYRSSMVRAVPACRANDSARRMSFLAKLLRARL